MSFSKSSLKPLIAIVAVCCLSISFEGQLPQPTFVTQFQADSGEVVSPELARKRKELMQMIFKKDKLDNVAKFLRVKKCKA